MHVPQACLGSVRVGEKMQEHSQAGIVCCVGTVPKGRESCTYISAAGAPPSDVLTPHPTPSRRACRVGRTWAAWTRCGRRCTSRWSCPPSSLSW